MGHIEIIKVCSQLSYIADNLMVFHFPLNRGSECLNRVSETQEENEL